MRYVLVRYANIGDSDNPVMWGARISPPYKTKQEAIDFKRKLCETRPWLTGEVRVEEATK